jgi:hypothetical protein
VHGGRWVQRQFVPLVPGEYQGWGESNLEGHVPCNRDISLIAAADTNADAFADSNAGAAEWPAVRVPLHT